MFEMTKDDQSRVVPEWCATVTASAPDFSGWILTGQVRMVRFHGFWHSYSWSSWNTPIYTNIAFMKHTKRLFVRLINSCAVHTFHSWGYLIAPVDFWWDTDLSACEMPAFCTHQNPPLRITATWFVLIFCSWILQRKAADVAAPARQCLQLFAFRQAATAAEPSEAVRDLVKQE